MSKKVWGEEVKRNLEWPTWEIDRPVSFSMWTLPPEYSDPTERFPRSWETWCDAPESRNHQSSLTVSEFKVETVVVASMFVTATASVRWSTDCKCGSNFFCWGIIAVLTECGIVSHYCWKTPISFHRKAKKQQPLKNSRSRLLMSREQQSHNLGQHDLKYT